MSEKKISFGFKLAKKQPLLLPQKVEESANKDNGIELIQCLEGKTIKVLHERVKEKPLVIPLLNAQKTSAALASLKNLKSVLDGENENEDEQKVVDTSTGTSCTEGKVEAQTIEQRVVAELLADAKNADELTEESNGGTIAVPLNKDKLSFDGAVESSQDDYDRIPISQFGLGMLRGMGLKDEEIKSNRNKEPELRPRGMGLGADKAIKKKKLLVEPAANEVLEIKKNAYVRILAGKYRDLYGQIEGLDDQSCRVIVKLALGGKKETLNEFMVQPVSKQEYLEYGKVINSAKYEEYKRKQTTIKEEKNTDSEKAKSSRDDERSRDETKSVSSNRHASEERFKHSDKQERHQFGERSEGRWSHHRRSRSKEQDSRTTSKCDDKVDERRHRSSDKRDDRREKYPSDHKRDKDRRRSSSRSCDSSDSENEKRHHRKSSKKHKKKSSRSKHHDSDGDDDDKKRSKKKSKKRERSRSRGRR